MLEGGGGCFLREPIPRLIYSDGDTIKCAGLSVKNQRARKIRADSEPIQALDKNIFYILPLCGVYTVSDIRFLAYFHGIMSLGEIPSVSFI